MMIFWLISICMLLLALLIVLLPLVRKHKKTSIIPRKEINISIHKEHLQELKNEVHAGNLGREDFENAMQELEHELIQDVAINEGKKGTDYMKRSTWTIVIIAILMPVFVIGLYLRLGDVDVIKARSNEIPQQAANGEAHSIEDMVERLRNRLQTQPDDVRGWQMLGRSYVVINRFDDAVKAYRKVYELGGGDDPGFLADFSEALVLANDNRFTDETLAMLSRSLKADPDEPKALWLSGFAALEQGNNTEALQHWERLLPLLPPGGEDVVTLQQHINQIKQDMGLPTTSESTVALNDKNTASMPEQRSAAEVNVDVSLDTGLAGKTGPGDTVFIFAKAAQGPPMPLAILRKQVKDLPLKATLDDSMAMSPAMKLSSFNEIIIGARISKSGNAMPQSGDLQGLSNTVSLNEVSGAVKIIINQVVP